MTQSVATETETRQVPDAHGAGATAAAAVASWLVLLAAAGLLAALLLPAGLVLTAGLVLPAGLVLIAGLVLVAGAAPLAGLAATPHPVPSPIKETAAVTTPIQVRDCRRVRP